jgi:NAD(P)-dependent dehydrogenase (short-subunit alcohol dehydrogenase family)
MTAPEGTDASAGTVLITGAARGLGRALSEALADRDMHVLVAARDLDAARSLASSLREAGRHADAVQLDIASDDSVASAFAAVRSVADHIDILVNNAATDYDEDQDAVSADLARVKRTLDTNLFGAWRCTQAFLPLLRRGSKVIMVTSEDASLENMTQGVPGYRISKVGLNALTRIMAAELAASGIDVRAVSPGWTATDMGGPEGRPVKDGVNSILAGIDLPQGTTGTYHQDGAELPW